MNAKDPEAHVRLNLSGDFNSPLEVLASKLDKDNKRAILETWVDELSRIETAESDELMDSVRDALARLDAEE